MIAAAVANACACCPHRTPAGRRRPQGWRSPRSAWACSRSSASTQPTPSTYSPRCSSWASGSASCTRPRPTSPPVAQRPRRRRGRLGAGQRATNQVGGSLGHRAPQHLAATATTHYLAGKHSHHGRHRPRRRPRVHHQALVGRRILCRRRPRQPDCCYTAAPRALHPKPRTKQSSNPPALVANTKRPQMNTAATALEAVAAELRTFFTDYRPPRVCRPQQREAGAAAASVRR